MNVVEEEVIFLLTSEFSSTPVASSSVDTTVTTSAIPVTVISGNQEESLTEEPVDPLQYEEPKEEYCIMEEEISSVKEKKSRRRGIVWNYFIPTLPDRAQCSFCSADISYKGKSTNNLLRHLRTKHSENSKTESSDHKVESCLSESGSTYYVLSTPVDQPQSPIHSNDEEESSKQFKRRGGVWKFFSTDVNKRAKCKFCLTLISFKGGSTTNLLRHMKSKHSNVKVPNKISKSNENLKVLPQTISSIQHSFAEIVNECMKSDDENEYQIVNNIQYSNSNDSNSNDINDIDNNGSVGTITTLSSMDPNFPQDIDVQNIVETTRERKKSAVAWKYFTMESDERGKCGTCGALISFKGGSTGNLLRHLKTKHSEIDLTPEKKEEPEPNVESEELAFETIENKELAKFVQLLNPKYKLRGIQVPRLHEKEVPKRIRKRGAALNYFNIIPSNEYGTCQICGASVNLKNGSKAPLLRHLKAKHPDKDILLVSMNSSTEEVAPIDQQTVNIENIENIPMQINNSPIKDKTRKMRKRGLVWNHFAPLEDEKAKCIACPAVISYKRGSTSNLLRHMKKKHPEIDVHDEDHLKVDELTELITSDEENEDTEIGINDVKGKYCRKLLRKRGRVWNHFKPIGPDKAKCGLCNVIVIYLKGSTTNLLRHMKKKHPSIDLSKEKPFNKRLVCPSKEKPCTFEVASASMDCSNELSLATSSEKVNAIYRRSEVIFRKHFDKFLNRPVSVTKSKLYDEQLAKMIVKQYCPFTIVESEDFKKFVQTVNPGYSLPSRKTISSRLIPELYEKCVEDVREHLRNVRYITITTNGWTLVNNECYISITAHFIDDECKYQSYLLDCFKYEEKHTAENLAAEIKTILTNWGLIHKVNAVVSDNAANITAAIRLRSWRHIPCFANMLNLVVQAGLFEIREIYDKVKVVIDYLKKSPLASKKLAATQKQMAVSEVKLKSDDPTRWDSTLDMFQRLIACKEALSSLDSYVESLPMLNQYEWLVLEKICVTLKPFLDITNEISEKNITISKVIPLSRCIGNYLKKILTDKYLPKELIRIINKMLEEITLRFSDVEDNTLLAESTLLDPRFKNHAFVNEQSYSNTYHSILQKASNIKLGGSDRMESTNTLIGNSDSEIDGVGITTLHTNTAQNENNIWDEFDSQVNHISDVQNPETAAAAEMENYLQETLINRNADPLIWWKDRKYIYPRLFEIMKQRLCIAATAVSKNFTNGGQLVCEKRNKLSSSKVSMVLFLNHNL